MTLTADEILALAKRLDPEACWAGNGDLDMDGCMLIDAAVAEAFIAQVPGSYDDPNDPPTPWTRVVVPPSPRTWANTGDTA